jgi:exopolysaccharide biosynthesis polyprenyl glycosylphosphotransferase
MELENKKVYPFPESVVSVSSENPVLTNQLGRDANVVATSQGAAQTTTQTTLAPSPLAGVNTAAHAVQHASVGDIARDRRLYRIFLAIGDALVLFLAFTLAYWLRFQAGVAVEPNIVPTATVYLQLTIELIAVWLILFAVMGLYDYHNLLGGVTEYTRVVNACTVGMFSVVLVSFINPGFVVARAWLVMAWVLSIGMVAGYRLLMRRLAYRSRAHGHFVVPTVIVGTNAEATTLAEQLSDRMSSGVEVLGLIETRPQQDADSVQGFAVLGNLENVANIIQRSAVREVIVVPSALNSDQLVGVSQWLTSMPEVDMRLSSGLYEVFTTGMRVTTRNSVPLMQLNRLRLSPLETMLKSMLDYGLILLATPVLVPLFTILYLLVKLDSPGPVFYRRRVMGVGGQQFDAFKFRTMYVNGDAILAQHPELLAQLKRDHKLKNDPRVTRMGKFLRRTSLDELAQLVNVALRQMSLVGPRMISPAEAEMYGRMKNNLLTVKPGLTGLWQVSGRSDLSYEERVRLDMFYVRNYSIWLDIQILFFQTLPAVIKGRGAF